MCRETHFSKVAGLSIAAVVVAWSKAGDCPISSDVVVVVVVVAVGFG